VSFHYSWGHYILFQIVESAGQMKTVTIDMDDGWYGSQSIFADSELSIFSSRMILL
jgi:hypothetical protein